MNSKVFFCVLLMLRPRRCVCVRMTCEQRKTMKRWRIKIPRKQLNMKVYELFPISIKIVAFHPNERSKQASEQHLSNEIANRICTRRKLLV